MILSPAFFITCFLSFSFCTRAHIYQIEPSDLEGVIETYPSVVLFYNLSDQSSATVRNQFSVAARDLGQYGVLLGEFDCRSHPELCEKIKIQETPELVFYQYVFIISLYYHAFLQFSQRQGG